MLGVSIAVLAVVAAVAFTVLAYRRNANLRNAKLDGALFGAASFVGSCLTGATFVGARGLGPLRPDFTEVVGSGVDFSKASLDYSTVTNSELTKVKLARTSTRGVRLPRAWTSPGSTESAERARFLCRAQR